MQTIAWCHFMAAINRRRGEFTNCVLQWTCIRFSVCCASGCRGLGIPSRQGQRWYSASGIRLSGSWWGRMVSWWQWVCGGWRYEAPGVRVQTLQRNDRERRLPCGGIHLQQLSAGKRKVSGRAGGDGQARAARACSPRQALTLSYFKQSNMGAKSFFAICQT